jgi:hypothetical protein
MNGKPDVELEDRLRARLRELDGVAVAPYTVLRERAGRPRGASRGFAFTAATVILVIVVGAIVGDRLRESRSFNAGSPAAANGDCGAQTSQRDSTGHLVGVSKDTTTILVLPLSVARPEVDTWFDWYMTSAPGTAPLDVYAEYGDGSRIPPTLVMQTGPDRFLVRLAFPKSGCWRLHAERAGGTLSGDIWLQVLAAGATASADYANADCSATSRRDATGRLIGTTGDSTAILVSAPPDLRAGAEITFAWYMTSGGLASPFTVYAQYGDGSRVTPRSIETVGPDDFRVHLAFPKPGCWRLHSERIGGKLSGDVWLQVLPSR